MSITAQDVKALREKTGAGMMDCKKALQESNGNMDEAIDFLKKQGLAKAVKKGDRVAAEGLIFTKVGSGEAALVELNCETDFVAKNDDFINLGNKIAESILAQKPSSLEEALKLSLGEQTIEEAINSAIAVIGEKISLRRFELFSAKESGDITLYDHNGGKIAVLIETLGEKVVDVARDVAMQIAAMAPQYLDASEVSQEVLDKEKEVQIELLKQEGKPENMIEKIVQGKLNKFAGEISLLQQVYVKDMGGKKKVADVIKETDANGKVVQFCRYAVGEGIEKKQDDFADEVAKMAQ
ncbi:MAG: elongation factor Ts [Deltaproteobacteria bacterium]|nr:elongation factor Ts [Deltaproteobacteria bacterium]